jgi:hypothetical protein
VSYVEMKNRKGLQGLRGYGRGMMPIPVYGFRGLGCACAPKRLGEDLFTGLNPDGTPDVSWITAGGGVAPAGTIPNVTDPMNPNLLPNFLNLPQTSTLPSFLSTPTTPTLPGVSPSALLAAAALPNAPVAVQQAAAQYRAANPVTATLAGISTTTWLLGGGALLLVVVMASKRR